ncbi:DUF397 domain-containing protein [Amycolatopsis sp. PS_44_ISF1]|uniref:DUF397 domain-containing protein n=1 Tax=Amycolatopsis sp. PS_44_ISF1 TaxID=2974917 RepID=UPI0028DF1E9C|nr:DUF397 domain-containing protein [Amycolatopsis sp. PS_44_ISF1]MDT8910126.1 DUF397 domain-containing protein [Amycolatopsis sp. PS_44_ISF1]
MQFEGRSPDSAGFDGRGWHRSSFSGPDGGTCVEVNLSTPGAVGVRDSKLARSPVLTFSPRSWCAFVELVRAEPTG